MPNDSGADRTETPVVDITTPTSLDAALESTKQYYGHPADMSSEPPAGPDEEGDQDESDEVALSADEAVQDDWKPKYKNHKEAEKGAKEAERLMHEATAKAKATEAENQTIKSEIAELRAAIESLKKAPETKQAEEQAAEKPLSKRETAARVANALKQMGNLDVDDPDYHNKVAELWVEAGFGAAETLDKSVVENLVEQRIRQEREAQRAAENAKTAELQAVDYANKKAMDLGLDMTPGSPDHKLFWLLSDKAPQGVPFDEQISHVAKEVREIRGPSSTELKTKAANAQKQNSVMGRGSSAVDITPKQRSVSQAAPMSITEALKAVEKRL